MDRFDPFGWMAEPLLRDKGTGGASKQHKTHPNQAWGIPGSTGTQTLHGVRPVPAPKWVGPVWYPPPPPPSDTVVVLAIWGPW